jgi:hypothetical protein
MPFTNIATVQFVYGEASLLGGDHLIGSGFATGTTRGILCPQDTRAVRSDGQYSAEMDAVLSGRICANASLETSSWSIGVIYSGWGYSRALKLLY